MEKVPWAVRKAMAYVVNQHEFVDSVFKGRGAPAYHLMPPALFDGGQQAYDAHYMG
jgi:peptide/nickel transport system substrate-binding protein